MKPMLYYRIMAKILKTGADWDKLAPAEENAIEYAHNVLNDEPVRETNGIYSLEYCLAHSGETINKRYRDQKYMDEIDLQIPDMLNQYSTKAPIVVYRGVDDEIYQMMIDAARHSKGVDLKEKAFLATSFVKGHEINTKIKLRIYLPAGTHAVYMGDVNYEEKTNYEVTVQYDAELKIISIDKEYINCLLLKTA